MYRIECGGCEKVYVGETKRTLKTRVGEHQKEVEELEKRLEESQAKEAEMSKVADQARSLKVNIISKQGKTHQTTPWCGICSFPLIIQFSYLIWMMQTSLCVLAPVFSPPSLQGS